MKVGIYIPGLGENYKEESVLKYATRFMYELDWNHKDARIVYSLKHEAVLLSLNASKTEPEVLHTTKVSIIRHNVDHSESIAYCFYDLPYERILTDKYDRSNIFRKSLLLLLTILRKLPRILGCIFNKKATDHFSHRKRLQSFYAVMLLVSLGIGGILLIPSIITVLSTTDAFPQWISSFFKKYSNNTLWYEVSHYIAACSLTLLTITPKLNVLLLSLTAKIVCIHYYLQIGERKQAILGRLDRLIEFISESEAPDTTIQLHACDFGSVIGYDLLFPAGTVPTERVRQKVTALCTISFPYEFISSYYPTYFKNRDQCMSRYPLLWYNIHSTPDFFSSNIDEDSFRKIVNSDSCRLAIHNMHYDIVEDRSFFDFLGFVSFKTYQYYWDDSTDGASCLRLVVRAMMQDRLI